MTPTGTSVTPFPGAWRPNPGSSVPLFEQLRLNIIERADNGTLAPGTKLPAVRSLAGELGVAPHTVARAYKELEAEGLISSRRRAGTVVNELPGQPALDEHLVEAVDRVWALAAELGVDAATVKALVARRTR